MVAASEVLTRLAGKPLSPRKVEPVSRNFASKLCDRLRQRENKVFGNKPAKSSSVSACLFIYCIGSPAFLALAPCSQRVAKFIFKIKIREQPAHSKQHDDFSLLPLLPLLSFFFFFALFLIFLFLFLCLVGVGCNQDEAEHAKYSPISDVSEVIYICEEMWGSRSAYSGARLESRRVFELARFDRSKPALPYVQLQLQLQWR